MSERSGGSSIGDAIGMMGIIVVVVLYFIAMVLYFIVIAILTLLASPGMLIVGAAKLAFGLAHSTRQVWVLSIAASLTILIVLVIVRRNVSKGVALHLLLCAATMILWSVLTYGFESKATEAMAAVFFPGFTMKEAPCAGSCAGITGETGDSGSRTGRTGSDCHRGRAVCRCSGEPDLRGAGSGGSPARRGRLAGER